MRAHPSEPQVAFLLLPFARTHSQEQLRALLGVSAGFAHLLMQSLDAVANLRAPKLSHHPRLNRQPSGREPRPAGPIFRREETQGPSAAATGFTPARLKSMLSPELIRPLSECSTRPPTSLTLPLESNLT